MLLPNAGAAELVALPFPPKVVVVGARAFTFPNGAGAAFPEELPKTGATGAGAAKVGAAGVLLVLPNAGVAELAGPGAPKFVAGAGPKDGLGAEAVSCGPMIPFVPKLDEPVSTDPNWGTGL